MSIKEEILALKSDDGMIHAEIVLEWARTHPESQLHASMSQWWDDTASAHQWRLHVVRRLIAMHITTIDNKRQTVSLVIDRTKGGGYREIDDVLRNRRLSEIMLEEALAELERVQLRYQWVTELTSVWHEVDAIRAKHARRKRQAMAEKRPGA